MHRPAGKSAEHLLAHAAGRVHAVGCYVLAGHTAFQAWLVLFLNLSAPCGQAPSPLPGLQMGESAAPQAGGLPSWTLAQDTTLVGAPARAVPQLHPDSTDASRLLYQGEDSC